MSTTSSGHEFDRRRLDDEFLDLVVADEDLLRAEFDAIIEASWSPPPANPPTSPSRPDRPGRRRSTLRGRQRRPETDMSMGLEFDRHWWAKQRSPPS